MDELAARSTTTTKTVRLISSLFLYTCFRLLILLCSFILEEKGIFGDCVLVEKLSELEPNQENEEVILPSMEADERSNSMDMELQTRTFKGTKETKSAILTLFFKFFKKFFGRNEVISADEGEDERLLWLDGNFCFEDDEDGRSFI